MSAAPGPAPARPEPGTEPWLRRYARQVVIRAIGEDGQRRLGDACARVAGDGPAAEACAVHLAAAGVGRVLGDGGAIERLVRAAGADPAGRGVPDVVVRVGTSATHAAPARATVVVEGDVLVEGDGAGGAIVRVAAAAAGARPLPVRGNMSVAGPIARAAGALAADAAMRVLLGAPPSAGIAVRADGSVGPA